METHGKLKQNRNSFARNLKHVCRYVSVHTVFAPSNELVNQCSRIKHEFNIFVGDGVAERKENVPLHMQNSDN